VSLVYPRGFDSDYVKPLLHKVSIYDQSETSLLYQSDPFNPSSGPSNTLAVQALEINQQIWQTNDAILTVDSSSQSGAAFDYPDVIDTNAVCVIESGKTEGTKENTFYGIIDAIEPLRFGVDGLRYNLYAKGFGVVPNHTFINFKKIAPPESLNVGAVISNNQNQDFFAHNLFKSVFEDQSIMPLLDYTLLQRLGVGATLTEISSIVKDFIPGIRNPLVVASQVLNLIADMCGAIWYVDEQKRVVFKYPLGENSGIVIKDFYDELDDGDYTSYILEPLSFVDSIRAEDGFAQRLFAVAEKSDIVGGSSKYIAFSSLFNKDIAQAVVPGASKFQNLSFILSKTGTGTDAPNPQTAKLFGFIVNNGSGNVPGNQLVATFSIPIKDIPTNPAPVYKLDINFRVNEINIDQLHWIVLQERGNEEGNTIRWWHDDDLKHVSAGTHHRHSAIRSLKTGRSDGDPFSAQGWVVSHRGPVYSHAFATTANVLCEASDPLSISKWGYQRPVEARVQAPLLKSVQATQQYLDLLVQITAKKIRKYNQFVCTIPNNLINTGTEVQVASSFLPSLGLSKNVVAQVQGVKYSFDASSNDQSVGSRQAIVQLLGYVSPLD
jgi:hypothetical protein